MTRPHPATYVAVVLATFAILRLIPSFFELVETDAPLQWWASRSTGFVAYAALWLAMIAGLMITSRGLDGLLNRKVVLELHQQWTLAAMVATLSHVSLVATDAYVDVSWRAIVVPGASAYMPGALALGTIAMWGLAVLSLSSWLQRRVSYGVWRIVHASAFGTFVLAITHGLVAGSDSSSVGAQVLYVSTAAVLGCALIFRALYLPARPDSGKVRSVPIDSPPARSVSS